VRKHARRVKARDGFHQRERDAGGFAGVRVRAPLSTLQLPPTVCLLWLNGDDCFTVFGGGRGNYLILNVIIDLRGDKRVGALAGLGIAD
jgi:hypothetical protein